MKKISLKILCFVLLISTIKINPQTRHSDLRNNIKLNEKTGFISAIYNADINIEGISPDAIAKNYLSNNYKLFGMKKDISDLTITSIRENLGTKHIVLKQFYEGIEVINASIVISLNRENKISMVVSNYHPISKLDIYPTIERNNAESKVKTLFNDFRNDLVTKSTLKIFVDENENEHLAWEIFAELSSGFPVGSVIIDANSGDVLQKNDFGQKYVNGSGRVFDPDPGTYLRDANLNSSSDVSSAYKSVTLANLNGNGYVQGKYATSSNKIGPDSLTYNANNSFSFDRYRSGFKEANIYYFIDKIRSYIDNLGLNPLWRGDYQAIQFDAIVSQYYNLGANAVCCPENNYEYILFGFNTDNPTMITGSEDQSVIIHEYGHALHDALISGGISDTPSDGSDLAGIGEGIGDYLAISYRRTTQPSNPFRPNEASNYTFPSVRTSIKSTANANYSTWSQENNYGKGSIWASTIMDLEYNTATDPSSGTKLERDVTTKLLLKCLYYINASRSVIDYVNAIFQADRDLYGGSHLSTIEQVFRNRGFFSGYEVSGTISQNTTWSNYRVVTGDVTVASGVTLTISENTFVYFDNNKKIIVNGNLSAVGISTKPITFTRSSSSGTWGGIQFNSGSSGNLQYCTIQYASTGVYCYNSSPTIKYSTIDNNTSTGLYCDYYSSPVLVGNNFRSNTSYGIRCNSFSSPNLTDNGYPGSNVIRNNSGNGLYVTYNCSPNLNGYMTYGNSVFDNSSYEVAALYNCTVYADRVYWGATYPPPGGEFYAYQSTINNSNPLQSNPNPGRSIIPIEDKINTSPIGVSYSVQTDDFDMAEQKQREGKYNEAIDLYLAAFKKEKDNSRGRLALIKMEECFTKSGRKDYLTFSAKETKPLLKEGTEIYVVALELETHQLVNMGRYEDAMFNLFTILKNYNLNSDIEKNTLFRIGAFYVQLFGDMENAEKVFAELKKKYSGDPLLDGIELVKGLTPPEKKILNSPIQLSKDLTSKGTNSIIETSISNYPNPFNPTTKIIFSIPQKSQIKLKVFDILGREVANLADGVYEVGKYEVTFDASKLPSGVYFYNLTTGSNSISKKMLLVK